ncbi:MAG: dihydropteroate synthase [Pseudomonadota bacterium]
MVQTPSVAPDAPSRRAVALRSPPPLAGVDLSTPRVMAVLNVTPDSFSDGGRWAGVERAVEAGLEMVAAGADFLDIGGESTRPGATPVAPEEEQARVAPVIEGLRAAGCPAPLSIDTRNAATARAAFAAGARIFNDVTALGHDPESPSTAAALTAAHPDAGVILCHSQGDPATMQANPLYEHVVDDVAGALADARDRAKAAGVPEDRIVLDPGIGFGKTLEHNLELIRGLQALSALGCAVLLGVSRKRFIGTLGGQPDPSLRAPGSIAAGLFGVLRGARILRVHDVADTVQALRVWRALVDPAAVALAQ